MSQNYINSFINDTVSLLEVLKENSSDEEISNFLVRIIENEDDSIQDQIIEELLKLDEFIVKSVNASGVIKIRKDRKTRERLATQTTGISKARRRMIARKTVRTKKANKGIVIRAQRKRKRALRKRAAMGL